MSAPHNEHQILVALTELQDICCTMLSNADVQISLHGSSDTVELIFVTPAEDVTLLCSGFHLLRVIKDPADSDSLLVGRTNVTAYSAMSDIRRLMSSAGWSWADDVLPDKLFLVETSGGVEIRVVCTRLECARRSH